MGCFSTCDAPNVNCKNDPTNHTADAQPYTSPVLPVPNETPRALQQVPRTNSFWLLMFARDPVQAQACACMFIA
jgi:hypothetical protein